MIMSSPPQPWGVRDRRPLPPLTAVTINHVSYFISTYVSVMCLNEDTNNGHTPSTSCDQPRPLHIM